MINEKDFSSKIELTGFRGIDESSMDIIIKNINRHGRRIAELCKNMEKLHITLKLIHEREKSEIYDIHAKAVDGGKVYVSHITDRNLFVAIDKALQKIINEMD